MDDQILAAERERLAKIVEGLSALNDIDREFVASVIRSGRDPDDALLEPGTRARQDAAEGVNAFARAVANAVEREAVRRGEPLDAGMVSLVLHRVMGEDDTGLVAAAAAYEALGRARMAPEDLDTFARRVGAACDAEADRETLDTSHIYEVIRRMLRA